MNNDFDFSDLMNDDNVEHVENECRGHGYDNPVRELMELHKLMGSFSGKMNRRMSVVVNHMKTCGECLSNQIAQGHLVEIQDYYEMGKQMGMGRLPKLHYMNN